MFSSREIAFRLYFSVKNAAGKVVSAKKYKLTAKEIGEIKGSSGSYKVLSYASGAIRSFDAYFFLPFKRPISAKDTQRLERNLLAAYKEAWKLGTCTLKLGLVLEIF